ncbi:alkylation response protein AidB-like acyl-CoA dehydrogenase [Streptomyces sp. CEV 2-1]|nr:alkylation response protein AidB-like acyl-CoA dehydrogenase [Streptomyces sp. CEV 2-1]
MVRTNPADRSPAAAPWYESSSRTTYDRSTYWLSTTTGSPAYASRRVTAARSPSSRFAGGIRGRDTGQHRRGGRANPVGRAALPTRAFVRDKDGTLTVIDALGSRDARWNRPGLAALGEGTAGLLGLRAGDQYAVRFADGATAKPRIAQVLPDDPARGDFVLPRRLVRAHDRAPRPVLSSRAGRARTGTGGVLPPAAVAEVFCHPVTDTVRSGILKPPQPLTGTSRNPGGQHRLGRSLFGPRPEIPRRRRSHPARATAATPDREESAVMSDRAPQSVERRLPTEESRQLIALVRDIAQREIAPRAAEEEDAGRFPREVFTLLSASGLLGLPYDSDHGGGDQPYEVYLQVLEELAAARLTVGLGVSVHSLACHGVAGYGTKEQQAEHLPSMLAGGLLGAYCLSEPASGSDAASLRTKAVRDGDDWVITGTKAWITHGGVADFYTVLARTGADGARGITAFLVPGDAAGLSAAVPEKKMGMKGSPTAQLHFDGVRVPDARRIGEEGQGFAIALSALDSGRLGIAACAIGVAQAALDEAVAYATGRKQFGRPIADFQGLRFMLADMATQIEAGRALYLEAARLRDAGSPFSRQAAMAKLFCTDAAMRVTTDAVQVLGGYGYTLDFPVERFMREAKVLQIVEGTNQIQRMVIARHLAGPETH